MIIKSIKNILKLLGVAISPRPRKPLFNKNRTIKMFIGRYELLVNRSHVLPFYIKHHPQLNKNLARVAAFLQKNIPDITIIDIGANVGDTVCYIKNEVDAAIICIEGSDFYYSLLKKNIAQFNNVEAYKLYLGEKSEIISASVDVAAGTSEVKTSSSSHAPMQKIQIDTLDDFISKNVKEPGKIKLIKIDTDGFDMKIIKGATKHLKNVKPVLFFEYDTVLMKQENERGIDTLQLLQQLGYQEVFFYDNFSRFIVSLPLQNISGIQQMHNYICNYLGAFQYYDLCIFHADDSNLAKDFLNLEMQHQIGNNK